MWKRLKAAKYGEWSLWIGFAILGLGGLLNGSSDAVTMAGLCALAAIGVRATRPGAPGSDNDR